MIAQEVRKVKLDPLKVNGRMGHRIIKCGFDVLASRIALILLSPLFLVLVILIKEEDGGPAFYSQGRTGKDEKPFKMWKFRSMIVSVDKMAGQLREQNEIGGAMLRTKDDPRVTKAGHVIREYSLDELLQLWNVLKGDMSLIGPCPPLPIEAADYINYDELRLTVTPGCTGLWQATKRNVADFDEMVELNLGHISNGSLWFDFKILLKTAGVVIHPNSVY